MNRPVKLLMHVCCGPCAVLPVKRFMSDRNIELAAVFYNPNIHPIDELERRKEGALTVAESFGVPLTVYDDCFQEMWEEFEEKSKDGPGEPCPGDEGRCLMCYRIRLAFVARKAKEESFDAFTTSLLISPYQNHDLIKEIGYQMQSEYGVKFHYEDFRPEFREGQKTARDMGVYRQKYCGCIISYRNMLQKS